MKAGKSLKRYEVVIFSALAVLVLTLTGLLLNVGVQGVVLV